MEFNPQGSKTGDYDEWGSGDFTPPSEGWHILQVVECERTQSSTNREMIKLRAKVILSDDEASEGRSVFENFILEPEFFGKLSSLCMAVDPEMVQASACDGRFEGDDSGLDLDEQASLDYHILRQPFRARIYHKKEMYKGEKTIKAQVGKYETVRQEDAERLREKYGDNLVPELAESSSSSADDVY